MYDRIGYFNIFTVYPIYTFYSDSSSIVFVFSLSLYRGRMEFLKNTTVYNFFLTSSSPWCKRVVKIVQDVVLAI